MKILIVEDDHDISGTLRTHLAAECFAVDVAETGAAGIRLGSINDYDLVIVDLTLPDMDGSEVIAALRERPTQAPILVLTVISDAWSKVRLLNAGADDYLEKPFLFEELLARIRSLLRRPQAIVPVQVQVGEVVIDTASHTVERSGEAILLTRKEYALLEFLVRNRGTIVSRAELIEHVWDSSVDLFCVSVDTHIMNIRRKLGDPTIIETVHSRGYLIR